MTPAPVSPYGLEKITGEYYMSLFHQLYGVQTVSLRYFNVFGPRQDPGSPYSGVISIFVDRLLSDTPPTIFGDGQQSRDFVFVDDVVQANLLAASVPGAAGRFYNVGRGQQTTLLQLLSLLGQITSRQPTPEHAEPRAGDIRASLADISRAREELGFEPQVEVLEGLKQLLDRPGG
jgi:UDP-glucose 4-epimerase